MAAILLMVGKHLEQPDIVQQLLDVQLNPCKPQYRYAPEVVHSDIHSRHRSKLLCTMMQLLLQYCLYSWS